MHLLCKWTEWGEPYVQQMVYVIQGKTVPGYEHRQRRECTVCGAVQERIVG